MEYFMSVDELSDLFLRVVNCFNEMEKIPYFTGTDMLLHLSEVHLVESIGKNENINVTMLAKLQGVTKGAISQMIRKLVRKGLVLKNISPETENEVVLRLTEKGKEVFELHQQYHERLNQQLAKFLSEIPEDAIGYLGKLGMEMGKVFNDITEERRALLNVRHLIQNEKVT